MKTLKTAMLAATILAPLASPASAQTYPQPSMLATVGNWSVISGTSDSGRYCMLTSPGRASTMFALDVNESNSSALEVRLLKTSWAIPPTMTGAQVTVSFNDGQIFGGPLAPMNPTTIGIHIGPHIARSFIHEFTADASLSVQFSGTEPAWYEPLTGTTAIWSVFMNCIQAVNPTVWAMIAAPSATQPYAAGPYSAPSTQPFTAAPVAGPQAQQPGTNL